MIKRGMAYILIFFGTFFFLTGILVASAMIPKHMIRENLKKSAGFLCEGELFGKVVKEADGSKIDRYADSILLGIAYSYDDQKPLRSVMESKYYQREAYNANENLYEVVTEDYEGNQQYLRYWHGSNTIVRPLLVIFHLEQIYVLHGVVIGILIFLLLLQLFRRKAYVPAAGMIAGLIMTTVWFVPLSLEYTWTYIIMLAMSVIGIRRVEKRQQVAGFFLLGGMLTCYLDFLTTETITLTVPLLLMLWIERSQNNDIKTESRMAVKSVTAWLCGYAGMWLMKWLTATIVLSDNVLPYVGEHVQERMCGDLGMQPMTCIAGALYNNLRCLFPFSYGSMGSVIGIVILFFSIYFGYVYRKKTVDRKHIVLYALIGGVPYVRYIVLHNHSYLHYFFTYRAQMVTVMAAVFIFKLLIIENRWGGDNI